MKCDDAPTCVPLKEDVMYTYTYHLPGSFWTSLDPVSEGARVVGAQKKHQNVFPQKGTVIGYSPYQL